MTGALLDAKRVWKIAICEGHGSSPRWKASPCGLTSEDAAVTRGVSGRDVDTLTAPTPALHARTRANRLATPR